MTKVKMTVQAQRVDGTDDSAVCADGKLRGLRIPKRDGAALGNNITVTLEATLDNEAVVRKEPGTDECYLVYAGRDAEMPTVLVEVDPLHAAAKPCDGEHWYATLTHEQGFRCLVEKESFANAMSVAVDYVHDKFDELTESDR